MKGYDSGDRIQYIIESSDSKIIKIIKDVKLKKELNIMRHEFIIYLKANRKDFDPAEIKNAKTEEDKKRIVKKYENDYKTWQIHRKHNLVASKIIAGDLIMSTTGLSLPLCVLWLILFGINVHYVKELEKNNLK